MKRRPALFRALLVLLLLFIGISVGFILKEFRRGPASRALIRAIYDHDTPAAIAALKAGADPNAMNQILFTHSFLEQCEQFLDRLDRSRVQEEPQLEPCTALMLCFDEDSKDDPVLVQALLEAGADPNVTSPKTKGSPLMFAAAEERIQVLHLLIRHGAHVNAKDDRGQTALHYAAERNNTKALTLLLDAGAGINMQDNEGDTPLSLARVDRNLETVRILLERHADPNLRRRAGKPLMFQGQRVQESCSVSKRYSPFL